MFLTYLIGYWYGKFVSEHQEPLFPFQQTIEILDSPVKMKLK